MKSKSSNANPKVRRFQAWRAVVGTALAGALALPVAAQGPLGPPDGGPDGPPLCLGLGTGPGGPGGPGGMHARKGPGGGPGSQMMAQVLGLSDEQKASLEQLHEANRQSIEPICQARQEVLDKLHEALASDAPDPAAVGALVIESHRLSGQLREFRDSVKAGFEGLLSAEQKEKLGLLQELREAAPGLGRRGGFAHRGGAGPDGPEPPPEG